MTTLKFSGHETFIIRGFWPKKAYDFIRNNGNFNADDAVVHLGVGKNMVSSISFWMKALGLIDIKTGETTELADFLFGQNGVDPYLEDIASIWLLHYQLVKTNYSSIYSAVFNRFRTEKPVFTKSQLLAFIKRLYAERDDDNMNAKTVEKDINAFCRLYNTPDYKSIKKDYEDEISSLMLELELMSSTTERHVGEGKIEWFYLYPDKRRNLPTEVTLFSILDQYTDSENIAMRRLETEKDSPGMVFMLSKEGLYQQLKDIESKVIGAIVSETAGNIVLSLPTQRLDKWEILRTYYAN